MLQLLELFPDADIYTSVYDPELCPEAIRRARVHTSFLDRLPGAKRYYPRLLPLMNTAFESFDLDGYDLVLSSNHACAKNVITALGTLHVCYCHTPMSMRGTPASWSVSGSGGRSACCSRSCCLGCPGWT